ncbi:MAG: protein-export chaperone SecB [Rudanella sp.]|nr:protein-export chaperone SecB [Rudanella sp.]
MEIIPLFTLQKIDLLDVTFHRAEDDITDADSQTKLQINLSRRTELPFLYVTLEADVWQEQEGQRTVEAKVKMGGQFLVAEGVEAGFLDNFADINAPAIVFPFVRETIASLTTRAGIPTVLLQPLNFVDMAQRRQQQLNSTQQLSDKSTED